jgi:hypothetical protein
MGDHDSYSDIEIDESESVSNGVYLQRWGMHEPRAIIRARRSRRTMHARSAATSPFPSSTPRSTSGCGTMCGDLLVSLCGGAHEAIRYMSAWSKGYSVIEQPCSKAAVTLMIAATRMQSVSAMFGNVRNVVDCCHPGLPVALASGFNIEAWPLMLFQHGSRKFWLRNRESATPALGGQEAFGCTCAGPVPTRIICSMHCRPAAARGLHPYMRSVLLSICSIQLRTRPFGLCALTAIGGGDRAVPMAEQQALASNPAGSSAVAPAPRRPR